MTAHLTMDQPHFGRGSTGYCTVEVGRRVTAVGQDRMASRLAEIRPFVDERARRLLLGAEARAIGYGGVRIVAAASKAKGGHGVSGCA